MSGTTQSGTPITALKVATAVAETDKVLGVVKNTDGTQEAQQVPVGVISAAVSEAAGIPAAVQAAQNAATTAQAASDASYKNATQAVNDKIGVAGGAAQLDSKAQLLLQGESSLAITPATAASGTTPATPAKLFVIIPLDENTTVGNDGTKLQDVLVQALGALQKSAALQPGGYVPLDASSVGQFTKSGFNVPMRDGDTTSPLKVGYYANYRELTFQVTTPGGNIVAFENLAPNGYAAITFRGPDAYSGTDSFEHGALGYGPTLQWGQSKGYTFWEISSLDGNSNPKLCSVPALIQETGAHFSSYQEAQVVFNYNTNTIKNLDGSVFPDGINGQTITCQTTPDAFNRTATIVSGENTDTLTISQTIYVDSRDKTVGDLVRFGPTIYSQADHTVSQSNGNWDYYRFSDAYGGVIFTLPFLSIDRVAGRVGIGRPDPKANLHLVGQVLFSTTAAFDKNYSLRFNAAINVNVVPGGDPSENWGSTGTNSFLYLYGIGKAALLGNWSAANTVDLIDVNAQKPIVSIDMNGTQRFKIKQLFSLPSLTKAAILAQTSPEDGDCIMCSDLGVPVCYSATNAGWFPVQVGAKLTA